MDTTFTDKELKRAMDDVETSVIRCYKQITKFYGWPLEKNWGRGKRTH